jgi:hypothetical protein
MMTIFRKVLNISNEEAMAVTDQLIKEAGE